MPIHKSPREYLAPDLLKQWLKIVNPHVMGGRDLKMLKEELVVSTATQILNGFYQYAGNETITIPSFLKQREDWLVEEELWAEVELAMKMSRTVPKEWYLYHDLEGEQDSYSFLQSSEAKTQLIEWSQKVIA